MKLERVGIIVGIVAGVIAIWYYLKGSGGPTQVVYPNGQASGVPANQNAASTYNIQGVQRGPDPSLIYGNPPPLPPTPSYQSYNYAPINILGLSPQGAPAVKVTTTPTASGPNTAPGQKGKPAGDCCGCDDGCGCSSCSGGGVYQDGGSNACLVPNAAAQARSTPPQLLGNLAANIASSAVAGGQDLPTTPQVYAQTGQAPAQPQVNTIAPATSQPHPAPPQPGGGFLPWSVASKLLGLNGNSFAQHWYEQAAGFNGNG
jgi:hypothetical protein